jgi:hypothetical protein
LATAAAVTMFVARPDRGRAGHEASATMSLGERDGSVSHCLLVVGPERGQLGAGGIEGLTEPGDVAVAKDREDTGHQRRLRAVDLRPLGAEIARERLRGRQPERLRGRISSNNFRLL